MTNKLVLSGVDEYFNHQIALPHQIVASSDPGWRERYWVSIHDIVSRELVLSIGFGKYPNRDVLDGFAIAAYRGQQRNLRVSRQLMPKFSELAVGPLSAEIIEPLRKLRFTLQKNDSGIAFDLIWSASVQPVLEGRHFEVNRARVTHDLMRYVQTGRMTGDIEIGGARFDVEPSRWWAVRDHSWGVRPMSAVMGDPPIESVEWNFLAFCPIQFSDFSLHIYLFESQPGRPTHLSAAIMRPEGSPASDDDIKSVSHEFTWKSNAPVQTLEGGLIRIEFMSGSALHVEVSACEGRAFLKGGGYGSTQGTWMGESALEHDSYDLNDDARLRGFHSHSSDHLIEAHCNGKTGYGVIEYIVRRGYSKYTEVHRRR